MVRGLRGQLQRVPMPLSPRLKRSITAWIYLPPGYATSSTRFPVAYILHGAPGQARDCFVSAQVHRVAEHLILEKKVKPMILVGWDASGPKGADDVIDYLNRADGSWPMEDFITQELVPWIDANYRTQAQPQSRALIGFSAGGYGAANLGLKHPDIWSVMASHSGFFDPDSDRENITRILGPKSEMWDANNPILRVRELAPGTRLHFYMDVGRSDALLPDFLQMQRELQAQHIDYEAQIASGAHTWNYLRAHYRDSLLFVDRRWNEMASQMAPPLSIVAH